MRLFETWFQIPPSFTLQRLMCSNLFNACTIPNNADNCLSRMHQHMLAVRVKHHNQTLKPEWYKQCAAFLYSAVAVELEAVKVTTYLLGQPDVTVSPLR